MVGIGESLYTVIYFIMKSTIFKKKLLGIFWTCMIFARKKYQKHWSSSAANSSAAILLFGYYTNSRHTYNIHSILQVYPRKPY